MSVKFQVVLPETLAAELKREAARQGIPLSEWIRQTMSAELKQRRNQRSGKGQPDSWLDRLRIDDEPDISSRIDEVLYGE